MCWLDVLVSSGHHFPRSAVPWDWHLFVHIWDEGSEEKPEVLPLHFPSLESDELWVMPHPKGDSFEILSGGSTTAVWTRVPTCG
jgi:hypothetical protein